MSGLPEGREPGARRKKLAGYLKAANELRQSYQQSYTSGWNRRDAAFDDADDGTPGAFPDAAVVRNGQEEMILFPSYARRHTKSKPKAEPGTIQEAAGDGRDVRDSTGEGDAEFWKQQWDAYEDDHAVVDVDIRGWIYSPHKGQMSRKQRLFIGVARQLVGIQAPPAGTSTKLSPSASAGSSRNPSPHMGHRERAEMRAAERDAELTAKEAENILKQGEKEAAIASQGGFSERPRDEPDDTSPYDSQSRGSSPAGGPRRPSHAHRLTHATSNSSLRSEDAITPLQKRQSWNQPSEMSPAELAEANAHLMARIRHFLAVPMANEPISVFFYNEEVSKQRTVYTNASGHFNMRAALDFVPTHVRILASDKLSATEEINIIDQKGVSLISDIDDTIKHSAISSGAREIFRNAFIRDLGDLTIDGVREWYNRMAEIGVRFHYVSNSPWQLYPVIQNFFEMAGLPPGSFHLKQYTGMFQGIFEPVAERKKGTLDKIARDFPERSFILVGDSGEADLEVYTEFVLENPGRVLGVFIRDVTTSVSSGGFFDPSIGHGPGDRSYSTSQRGQGGGSISGRSPSPGTIQEEEDPELKAAIAASLQDMEEEHSRKLGLRHTQHDDSPERRPQLPPRKTTQPAPPPAVEKLIDFSDDEPESPTLRRVTTDTGIGATEVTRSGSIASTTSAKSMPPMPPKKPVALRSTSGENASPSSPASKGPPPPKPRRPSNSVLSSSPLTHQVSNQSRDDKPQSNTRTQTSRAENTYTGMARDKLSSAYSHLPAAPSYLHRTSANQSKDDAARSASTSDMTNKKAAPSPPPPRRGITSYPAAAASFASTKVSNAWNGNPNPTYSQASPYTTTSSSQYPYRSGANLGPNGNGSQNGGDDGPILSKKEILWRQRWARAEQVLGEKGVVLKSWRVGSDVMKDAVRLVEKAEKDKDREKRNGSR